MGEKFIFTFLFHLFGISLFLIPNKYQGPIIIQISTVGFRVVDVIAFILVVSGSVFLFVSLFLCLRAQARLNKAHHNNLTDKTQGPAQ